MLGDRPIGRSATLPVDFLGAKAAVPDRAVAHSPGARRSGRAVLRHLPRTALLRSVFRALADRRRRPAGAPRPAGARLRRAARGARARGALTTGSTSTTTGSTGESRRPWPCRDRGARRALARPTRWTRAELMQVLSDVPSSRARFIETRHSALLKKPLVLSGRLVYRRPDRLEKHVQTPFEESIIDRGIARVDHAAGRRRGPHVHASRKRARAGADREPAGHARRRPSRTASAISRSPCRARAGTGRCR